MPFTTETKTCQNCKKEFTIEPEDFKFYEKINVPAPTWCPECRMVRRFLWRNERSLYRRKCDATGKDIISMFSPEKRFVVYDRSYWWSDKWDSLGSGIDYDFSRPFFIQFQELFANTPLPAVFNTNPVNTEYGNHIGDSKDCYMLFASWTNERVNYSSRSFDSKDSYELLGASKLELSYEDVACSDSFKLFHSDETENSMDSSLLKLCKNVTSSLACINLRNISNYIFNKPFTKEDYEKELSKLNLGSYKNVLDLKEQFKIFSLKSIRKAANFVKTVNVVGDNIKNSKNCFYCFDVFGEVEDSKFVMNAVSMKDGYDGYGYGVNSELLYEGIDTGDHGSRNRFAVVSHKNSDVHYVYGCFGCQSLFACIGLRNKSYCILNKQYTKEEYEELVPKIIKHMNDDMPYIDKKGRVYKYGEFFPPELSPFAYNETIAQEYFPLTKEEALEQGYSWEDPEPRNYTVTLKNQDIPDHIKDVPDSILNEIIECAHSLGSLASKCNEQCTEAFRIIPQELDFLRKQNLPLPRLCPNCRHYQRIKQRNPLKLWHRKCQCAGLKSSNNVYSNTVKHEHGDNPCPNEFETSYAPERTEIVYCESCYLKEVM